MVSKGIVFTIAQSCGTTKVSLNLGWGRTQYWIEVISLQTIYLVPDGGPSSFLALLFQVHPFHFQVLQRSLGGVAVSQRLVARCITS